MSYKPFTLIKRQRKKGKPVFYVRFRNSEGSRTNAKSTGQTTKAAAEAWAVDYMKQEKMDLRENITLASFSKNFFDWNGNWAMDKRVNGKRISHVQGDQRGTIQGNESNRYN